MAGSHVTLNESVLVAGSHRPSFQMTTFVGFGGPAGRLSGFGPARTDSGIAGRSGAPAAAAIGAVPVCRPIGVPATVAGRPSWLVGLEGPDGGDAPEGRTEPENLAPTQGRSTYS